MPALTPNTKNAPVLNALLARDFLDRPRSYIRGRKRCNERCRCCDRNPPSGYLCEIVLDYATNEVARIGIGRCHHDFFCAALADLLAEEFRGAHPQRRQRMKKLRRAIRKLPRKL